MGQQGQACKVIGEWGGAFKKLTLSAHTLLPGDESTEKVQGTGSGIPL